jgi:hypothetical protein
VVWCAGHDWQLRRGFNFEHNIGFERCRAVYLCFASAAEIIFRVNRWKHHSSARRWPR